MVNIEKYEFHIRYSEEDVAYIGTVAEFPYLSADGSTPGEAYTEIKSVVEDAVEVLSDEGEDVPVPLSEREYKGNISLRLSPETHRMATIRAHQEGCSLNQFLTSLIERNLYADSIETAIKKLSVTIKALPPLADNLVQCPVQQSTVWAKSLQPSYPENYRVNVTVPASTEAQRSSIASYTGV